MEPPPFYFESFGGCSYSLLCEKERRKYEKEEELDRFYEEERKKELAIEEENKKKKEEQEVIAKLRKIYLPDKRKAPVIEASRPEGVGKISKETLEDEERVDKIKKALKRQRRERDKEIYPLLYNDSLDY